MTNPELEVADANQIGPSGQHGSEQFALVNRPDLVLDLWGTDSATTPAVMTEYQAGVTSRGLPADIWDSLVQLTLNSIEKDFAKRLSPKLGSGERSCLAIAVHRILVLRVRRGQLTQAEGNALLEEMITLGYRSPVPTLDDLL
jgi:predicted nucleic acid-binding protein